MELINQVFDYSQVDTEDKGILIKLESDIVKFKKRSVKEMLDFGGTCEAAHEILSKYGSGQFSEWIEVQGVSRQTAYNAMSAKSVFGVCPNLDKWEVSAMYALAKNGEAKKKALKLASKGVAITHSVARQLIEEARPEPIKTINHDTGEEGQTELDGTEPIEETSPSEPRIGTELAGEDDGQEFEEMDYEEDRVQTALKAIGGGPTSAKPDNSSIVLDAIGRPVPEKFIEAHGVSAAIQVQARKLDSILRSLKELSTEPGGDFIPQFDTDFGDLKGKIFGSCYWSECPKCKGVGGKCYDCKNKGWWPKEKSGHLSVDDKAWLGVE